MANEKFEIRVEHKTRYKLVTVVFGDHVFLDLGYMNDDEQEQLGKTLREAASRLAPVPLLCPYCGASATETMEG